MASDPTADDAHYVVTFDPRPITGPGAVKDLRRMTLADARDLRAYALLAPKHGRIVNVETLAVVDEPGAEQST